MPPRPPLTTTGGLEAAAPRRCSGAAHWGGPGAVAAATATDTGTIACELPDITNTGCRRLHCPPPLKLTGLVPVASSAVSAPCLADHREPGLDEGH